LVGHKFLCLQPEVERMILARITIRNIDVVLGRAPAECEMRMDLTTVCICMLLETSERQIRSAFLDYELETGSIVELRRYLFAHLESKST
jgi:hypothetical protein